MMYPILRLPETEDPVIVFLVGQLTNPEGTDWLVVGVFTEEQKAVDVCDEPTKFVCPVPLNVALDPDDEWFEQVYFPGAQVLDG